jgi:hypothetical protein
MSESVRAKRTLVERIAAAEAKELAAKLRLAKLKRQAEGADRKIEMQRKCALGGVLLEIADRGTDDDMLVVEAVKRYLAASTASATASNVAALSGTAFELSVEKVAV